MNSGQAANASLAERRKLFTAPAALFASFGKASLHQLVLHRVLLLLVANAAFLAASFRAAFELRFDLSVPPEMDKLFWITAPWVIGLKLFVFFTCGSLHGWWRFVTFADLAKLLQVSTLSILAIASIDYFLIEAYQIPRAVLLLDWGVTVLLIGGLRSAWRLGSEHGWPSPAVNGKNRVLVIGVDHGGETLVRQLHGQNRLNYRVVGFLDENRSRHATCLGGVPFLGSIDNAVSLSVKHRARTILVLADSVGGHCLRQFVSQCRDAAIDVKMIPSLEALLNGSCNLEVRDVDINDLLGREPVKMDSAATSGLIDGRCVLVTGAGGSIGGEICRQIARYRPRKLVLVERAENSLFHIEQELQRDHGHIDCHACIADICDSQRLEAVFATHRPQVVFHAAAHKHVPLMEFNSGEAIKNNVFGTRNVADVADAFGTERFVLISTDKAVKPTSIMGATKELAERYVQAMSNVSRTSFVVVRFGNVLGSAGSVVPIFQEQIRRGGPVTITHPEMRRYFMTIPEASQLVLQAAALGRGGETFVLDMGDPVKIIDLATDLIRLSGFSSDEIETQIVGTRPGEKLYEEIFHDEETTAPTQHPKLRMARRRRSTMAEVRRWLSELAPLVNASDEVIHTKLAQLAPGCKPPNKPSNAANLIAVNGNGNGNGNSAEKSHGNGHNSGNRTALERGTGQAPGNVRNDGRGEETGSGEGNGHDSGNGQDSRNETLDGQYSKTPVVRRNV